MAVGSALLIIFAVLFVIRYPWVILGLLVVIATVGAVLYVMEQRDEPRQQREAAARQVQERATLARIESEDAAFMRERETYRPAARWLVAAVDAQHCRYLIDVETLTLGRGSVNAWVKVMSPQIDPGIYGSGICYRNEAPVQVSFGCAGQYVGGAWEFTPGTVGEGILRWIQRSPWCGQAIRYAQQAEAERDREKKAALPRQAEWDQEMQDLEQRQKALGDELTRAYERWRYPFRDWQ